MKDNDMLSMIRSGEQYHLGLIYEKYRSEFIHWIIKEFKCSSDDSKDIYQITILIFYDNVRSGKLSHLASSVKTYLFGIGKNVARENQRRLNRSGSLSAEQMLKDYLMDSNEPADDTAIEAAQRAIAQLAKPAQKLIQLFYHEHKTMTEISTIMNYKNAETAKNQKCKIMATLRKHFRIQLKEIEKENEEASLFLNTCHPEHV